jgi:hypothetical protein
MALLSGCGTDASAAPVAKPSPPAAYPTSTTFTSVLQMKFPDDAYEPNAAQSAEIEYLNLRLTQQCMKGFGFDYLPTLSATVISQGTKVNDEVRTRLYGISDATAAAAYGFHVPSWVSGTTSPQTVAQLPAAERAVLDGQGAKSYDGKAVPADGCVGRTADLLSAAGVSGTDLRQGGSSGDDAASLPHTIELNAFQAAQSDPRVLAVFAKWSACMSGFGYHYGTPFAAAGDTRWTNAAAASPAEIQAAQHDIACKLRVNLLDVEYSVESGYEAAAIAKNAQTMAAAKTELSTEITGLNRLMKEYAE